MSKNKSEIQDTGVQDKKSGKTAKEKGGWKRSRGFQYGGIATAITAGFVIVVLLFNFGVSMLSNKVNLTFDLTSNKVTKISTKTVSFLKTIKQPVTIYVLAEESYFTGDSTYGPALKVIQQFPKQNSNISIQYVDTTKNPSFTTQFSKVSVTTGDIIVSSKGRYKKVAISDLISTTTDSVTQATVPAYDNAEKLIDSAVEYVTSSDLPTIMFTSGHDEQDSSSLQTLLTQNNYNVETKDISTDGLDSNATTLVVSAPKSDFTSKEISDISAFLDNNGKKGKNLIVFIDPTQSALPNLEDLTKEWGIQVGTGVVYDKTNCFSSYYFQPIAGTIDTTTLKNVSTNLKADLQVSAPLTLTYTTKGTRTTSSLVSSMNTSRLWNPTKVSQDAANSFSPSDSDQAGPFTVLALSTDSTSSSSDTTSSSASSNVLVCGSYQFISSTLLNQSSLSNSTILLDAVNNVTGVQSKITIEPKDISAASLYITSSQAAILIVVFIFLVPLGVLAAGLIVWLRRRHL